MKLEAQYLKDRLNEIRETHWLARLVRLMPSRERKLWDALAVDLLQYAQDAKQEASNARCALVMDEMTRQQNEGLRRDLGAEKQKVDWMRETLREMKGRPIRRSNVCRILSTNK